ncbi:MAG: helix-turn-helix domain-containing protein [Chitinophagales bacterium]
MDYKELGLFIRQERKARKLNQKTFSEMAGISERSLRSIEQGDQTHINTLRKVMSIFDYDLEMETIITLKLSNGKKIT